MTTRLPRVLAISGAVMVCQACLWFAGCGPTSGPDRPMGEVSGTVTLDDKPLADGEIYFTKVAEGVNDKLPVKDGKFEGKVSQGDRKVEVRAYKEVKAATEMYGADAPASKENFIPAQYNTDSTLKAEVKAGKNPPMEFAVKSQ